MDGKQLQAVISFIVRSCPAVELVELQDGWVQLVPVAPKGNDARLEWDFRSRMVRKSLTLRLGSRETTVASSSVLIATRSRSASCLNYIWLCCEALPLFLDSLVLQVRTVCESDFLDVDGFLPFNSGDFSPSTFVQFIFSTPDRVILRISAFLS